MNMKELLKRFLDFVRDNKLLVFLFITTTFLFLYQHYMILAWDFSAYVINAKYLFYHGNYFEVLRAPLTPIFLGFSLIFPFGEYVYIIIVSILFFYASIKLIDAFYDIYLHKYGLKKNELRLLFLLLIFNPFLLYYGLFEGTELLGLALFELFIYCIIKNKYSGHLLSLAVLTRYNFFAFFPFLFINKNYKKILINVLLFLLILIPWFLFNYFLYGNPFTSILDSYNNNIISRIGLEKPFNCWDFIFSLNILIPLTFLGIILLVYNYLNKREEKNFILYDLIFLITTIFVIFDYLHTPYRNGRYLFNLLLPFSYFSVRFLVLYKSFQKQILVVLFLFFVLSSFFLLWFEYVHRDSDKMYKDAAFEISQLNILNCSIRSNLWVQVNYYTGNVYSLWINHDLALKNKDVLLIFKDYYESENYLMGHKVLYENENFAVISNENLSLDDCNKKFSYAKPDVSDSCEVVAKTFEKSFFKSFFVKFCYLFSKNKQ